MRAGDRRHLISIEQPIKTKDKFKADTVEWQLFNKVWASIESLKGYEKTVAKASWPTATVKIGMPFIKGLLPTMRVTYEGVIYSILDVDDVDLRHRDVYLVCETGMKGA